MPRIPPLAAFAFTALLALATPVRAETTEERIAAALTEQGYVIVSMERTWLGRLRVLAEDGQFRRELVFNPVTGEILRDLSVLLSELESQPTRRDRSQNRDDTTGALATTASDLRFDDGTGTADDLVLPESESGMPTPWSTIIIPDPLFPGVTD